MSTTIRAIFVVTIVLVSTGLSTPPPASAFPAPQEIRLVEDLRIGALDGPEEYVFGHVAEVVPSANGAVYIVEWQGAAIRAYDRNGRFVRTIGGQGAGPGEYRHVNGLVIMRNGQLAVSDMMNMRISVYDTAGEYLTSHRVMTNAMGPGLLTADTLGRFYVWTYIHTGESRVIEGSAWVRVSPEGTIDTIAVPPRDSPPGFVVNEAKPFMTEVLSALSPLGDIIVGRNDQYSFEIRREGRSTISVRRPYERVPIRGAERSEWEGLVRRFQGNERVQALGGIGDISIPDFKPAYSEIRTDADGRIWVRRYVVAERKPRGRLVWREQPTFDVFLPSGEFVGTVRLPWDVWFYNAGGRYVWAVVRGEFDEQYVVRYTMERSPGE